MPHGNFKSMRCGTLLSPFKIPNLSTSLSIFIGMAWYGNRLPTLNSFQIYDELKVFLEPELIHSSKYSYWYYQNDLSIREIDFTAMHPIPAY